MNPAPPKIVLTGVVHLQTTAMGAEAFNRRWPDAHRPESADGIDRSCLHAWTGHSSHLVLDDAKETWAQNPGGRISHCTIWLNP